LRVHDHPRAVERREGPKKGVTAGWGFYEQFANLQILKEGEKVVPSHAERKGPKKKTRKRRRNGRSSRGSGDPHNNNNKKETTTQGDTTPKTPQKKNYPKKKHQPPQKTKKKKNPPKKGKIKALVLEKGWGGRGEKHIKNGKTDEKILACSRKPKFQKKE